ncbi:Up-regulated during septation-domain-containing protein [Chytridium lagenaria]|nr:Up-regulated during septation-domain-containing protein [Chytridium lagenaria]
MEDTPVVIPERRRRPTNDRDMIRNATDRLAVDRGDPPPPLEPDLLQPNPITRSPTSVSSPKLLSRTGTTATNVSGSSRTATPQTTTRTQPPTTLSRRNSTDSTASAETDLSKSRQQSRRDGSRSERGAPTPLREKIAGRSTSPGSNLDGSETSRSTRPTDPPIRSPLRDRSKSRERSRSNDLARDDANRKHMSGLTVNSTSSILEQADPSTLSTMLGDALQESKTYTIYTQERFEEKKKEFAVLSSQVASLQNRLTLESRIREAALALTKTNTDKAQSRTAQEQLATANRKVDAIATDLWKVTGKLMEVERVVLKHTAGVLRWGAAANKEEGGLEKGGTAELKSAESKIRESEREISVLKSTVLRLEGEGEPLRRDLENARRLLDQEREERARSERNFERRLKEMEVGRAGSPGSSDVNRLKLEVATLKAELSTTQEDFANVNDKLLGMQKQLDEDLGVMESKDRMISELLAELEEATNQLEMREKAAAAAVAASGEGASVVERRLREQVVALEERVRSGERSPGSMSGRTARNSVMVREQVQMQTEGLRTTLGGQLKEAMGEKERVVGLLEAEKRRVRELEEKLRKAESDTEDDEGGLRVNDEDMRSLKRLWVELPEVLSPKNRTPPVSPGGRGETFSVGELVVRVTKIVGERREMQRRLEGIEGELREARSEVSTSMKDMKMLDGREKELKNDLRNLERSNERLESELMHLKKQVKDAEIMNSTSSSSATRKLEEIQATHTREMTRKMRDAEREWVLNQDRKLRELERELTRKHEVECDDLKRKIESEIGMRGN